MEVMVNIDRERVLNDVSIISGHTARILGDMDKYSLTEDEENLVTVYIDKAVGDIVGDEHLTAFRQDEDIVFDLPTNWDNRATKSLEDAVNDFISNSVLSRWCSVSMPDKQPEYEKKATDNLITIQGIVRKRVKPIRV